MFELSSPSRRMINTQCKGIINIQSSHNQSIWLSKNRMCRFSSGCCKVETARIVQPTSTRWMMRGWMTVWLLCVNGSPRDSRKWWRRKYTWAPCVLSVNEATENGWMAGWMVLCDPEKSRKDRCWIRRRREERPVRQSLGNDGATRFRRAYRTEKGDDWQFKSGMVIINLCSFVIHYHRRWLLLLLLGGSSAGSHRHRLRSFNHLIIFILQQRTTALLLIINHTTIGHTIRGLIPSCLSVPPNVHSVYGWSMTSIQWSVEANLGGHSGNDSFNGGVNAWCVNMMDSFEIQ